MRDQHPIRTARRKVRQAERQRIGVAVPPCVLCIEDHHTAGRHHDPHLTAPVCQKHHREIHERITRAGISLQRQSKSTMSVVMGLRAMAIYQRAEADAMDRMANLLDNSQEE